MKLQQIVLLLMSFMIGALVYSMDWQREQDQKIADMDKLIERQSVLLEQRIEYDEYRAKKRRLDLLRPAYTDSFDRGVEVK